MTMYGLKSQFLLDPDVVFLNHGSYGATPRPVFAAYQAWQRRLERQPVRFLARELSGHLADARRSLGNYINGSMDDIVYVPNVTFALNIVARSLDLGSGDEVLTSDHEYGACDHVWQFLSQKRGFEYRQQPLAFPVENVGAIVDQLWRGVTARTKVIFLSHITSSTALRLPVETICRRARAQGILTIIDGAHAPGQIPLDVKAIGADFYFGNAHKWLCSPKGAGFLFARPQVQHLIEPLVVGWGWGESRTISYGSDYLDYLQWLGTNDLSAYLSVPIAIAFQQENDWPTVRDTCHRLLRDALDRLGQLTGLPACYPDDSFYVQMAVARLPNLADLDGLKQQLYDDFRVEVPLGEWRGQQFVRISIQAYNSEEDVDALLRALQALLPSFAS
ncbi:MAG: aminotransferase class V-fold PLP-dependent enzyme [Candidatus Promineifilaceae bacterium]|nr:aminotransferase class V-fold PLP-dependent enzyme [Candidatus Promineifilaceae bacterium]